MGAFGKGLISLSRVRVVGGLFITRDIGNVPVAKTPQMLNHRPGGMGIVASHIIES